MRELPRPGDRGFGGAVNRGPARCCTNCSFPLPGQALYCPRCGQSIRQITRPWLEFVRELAQELFDFDGRMLVSLKLLVTRPGFLTLEYINGRRLSYTSPLRMYLVISLVFFVVLPFVVPVPESVDAVHEVSGQLYSQAMFLLLPVFAALLKLLYRKDFYLSHLVFSAHLFSAMYIPQLISWPLEAIEDRHIIFVILQVPLLVYMIYYVITALHTVYGEGWVKSTLKFCALLITFVPMILGAIELASQVRSLAGS